MGDWRMIMVCRLAHRSFGYEETRRVYSPDGVCPTLNTCGGGNREPKVAVVRR